MNIQIRIIFAAFVLLSVSLAYAADRPEAVSPGTYDEAVAVEWRCPSFSWQMVDGASYELHISRIDDETLESEDNQSRVQHFPEGVSSWMPSGADCLERGASYEWSVTAYDSTGWSESSDTKRFSVPLAPSPAELNQAIEVLRAAGVMDGTAANSQAPAAPQATEGADPEFAIVGETASTADGSAGVSGSATGMSGATLGVIGASNSPDGAGVLGIAAAATGSDAAGVVGEATPTTGQATGVYGRTFSSSGAGVRAANLNINGGADLVLEGGAQGETDTEVSQSGLDRPSAGSETFNIRNSDSGDITLQVDGVNVVTTVTDQDTLGGLSCAEGEFAQVTGGNWVCAPIDEQHDPWNGVLMINASFFEERSGHHNAFNDQWDHLLSDYLYPFALDGKSGATGSFVAPVHLPDGATVTRVVGYYFDNDSVNNMEMSLWLQQRSPTTQASFGTMAMVELGPTSGSMDLIATVDDDTINFATVNNENFYWLRLVMTVDDASFDLRFYGARIEYTMP